MAEAILKAELKLKGISGVSVTSSGLSANPGQPIMPEANAALKALGYKPVKYRARQFADADKNAQDLIICMTEAHRRHIGTGDNIISVASITGLHDVSDPYGDSVDVYIKTAEYIKYACGDIIGIVQKALDAECKEKAAKAAAKPAQKKAPKKKSGGKNTVAAKGNGKEGAK